MEFGRRLVNHKPVHINLDIKETHFIFVDLVGVVDAITSSNMFTQRFREALRLIHFNFNDLQVMTGEMLLQFVIESQMTLQSFREQKIPWTSVIKFPKELES